MARRRTADRWLLAVSRRAGIVGALASSLLAASRSAEALSVVAVSEPCRARTVAGTTASCADAAAEWDSLRAEITRLLDRGPPIETYAVHRWRHVGRLYRAAGNTPLWIEGAQLGRQARALVDAIADAPAQALRLDAYPLAEMRSALEALWSGARAASLAEADVLLTAAFVAYAEDLLTGQISPRSVNREWHIDPEDVDVDSALARTLRRQPFTEALALLRPQDSDYAALMRELARYRAIVADGGWPRVPDIGLLRPGEVTSAGPLGLLLARLHAEGYAELMPLTAAAAPGAAASATRGDKARVLYDRAIAEAVAAYQRRHGLVADSIVGPSTLASLNQPAEYRLRQIAANLERHRWLPRQLGDRYVLVNVPAFRLRAYDGGREVLSMGVVVGAEYGGRTTPVFSDSMSYVVFRPYWNVPQGIAARELWPKQRRDPGYFRRNRYEVVRASWGTYVRQKPGPENALGHVKFIFPNDFNIYLHDTPARRLFEEHVRAFSHGCIRVERPDELARYVLGWDLDRVHAAMYRGRDNRRVYLERKLPVYIVYFTTYARGDELHFANDVYDRDDALVRAARGAALPPAEWTREASALRAAVSRLVGGL